MTWLPLAPVLVISAMQLRRNGFCSPPGKQACGMTMDRLMQLLAQSNDSASHIFRWHLALVTQLSVSLRFSGCLGVACFCRALQMYTLLNGMVITKKEA